MTALAFLQDPGRIVLDVDLVTMAEPLNGLGSLVVTGAPGDATVLVMGPFFAATAAIGLPIWAAQRVFWALLLVVGFLGMERLSGSLRLTAPGARIASGVIYALMPAAVAGLGMASADLVSYYLLPWILAFLAQASSGDVSARRAAGLSGVIVLVAGVGDRGVLIAAVAAGWWWVVCAPVPGGRVRLAGWWALASCAGIAWWVVPGLDAWTGGGGLRDGDTWTASLAALTWLAMACMAVVAATGAAGMVFAPHPWRMFLGGLLLAGGLLAFGLIAADRWPFGAGAAVALASVACSVGVGFLCARLLRARGSRGRQAVYATVIVAVVLGAAPLSTGTLVREGSVPDPAPEWFEAVAWLDRAGNMGRSIVVPGAAWADSPWTRVTGGSSVRSGEPGLAWLAAVESRLADGVGWPGLSHYLAQQGVRYVVVPGAQTGEERERRTRVLQGLSESSGFVRVAVLGGDEPRASALAPVEIWEARSSSADVRAPAWISTVRSLMAIQGGPSAEVDAGAVGVTSGFTTITHDDAVAPPGNDVAAWRTGVVIGGGSNVTPGSMPDVDQGPILLMNESGVQVVEARVDVASAADYRPSVGMRPRPGAALDALLMPAFDSSPRAQATSALSRAPAFRPQSSVDGNLSTAWMAGVDDPRPELLIEWAEAAEISGVAFVQDPDLAASQPLTVTATVGGTSSTGVVGPEGELTFPPRSGTALRLRFDNVLVERQIDPGSGQSVALPLGISEVQVLGLEGRPRGPALSEEVRFAARMVPQVRVDGALVSMCASVPVGLVLQEALVRATPCHSASVTLAAGVHQVGASSTDVLAVEYLALDVGAGQVSRSRPVPVQTGQGDRRVAVEGDAAIRLLEVPDTAVSGWTARLGDLSLNAVTIGGWRQGWLLPSGAGGVVTLRPSRSSLQGATLASLFLGGAVLVTMCLVRNGRRSPADTSAERLGPTH